MADIELRLGHDMLVLSAPIDATLARQGIDAARDRQYLNLMEPDAISDALKLELLAGAQCLVTTTEDITRSRLAHVRMENDAEKLSRAAVDIAASLKPQHILAEIGPCGLPLDASSKASLNESRGQYADAARTFESCEFDAFFLNGFSSIADMKCALMGVAQVSGRPVFASMTIGAQPRNANDATAQQRGSSAGAGSVGGGTAQFEEDAALFALGYEPIDGPIAPAVPALVGVLDPAEWAEAIAAMSDLGASVIGFETADPLPKAVEYARIAVEQSGLPVLAQVRVSPDAGGKAKALVPLEERTDYALDTMEHVAAKLYGVGVQFLRASGMATPAYTGALAVTVSGLDVRSAT